MDPLLALRALTADVEHVDGQLAHIESCFENARALLPYAQDVIDIGQVVRFGDPYNFREEAAREMVSMKLESAIARQRVLVRQRLGTALTPRGIGAPRDDRDEPWTQGREKWTAANEER